MLTTRLRMVQLLTSTGTSPCTMMAVRLSTFNNVERTVSGDKHWDDADDQDE